MGVVKPCTILLISAHFDICMYKKQDWSDAKIMGLKIVLAFHDKYALLLELKWDSWQEKLLSPN